MVPLQRGNKLFAANVSPPVQVLQHVSRRRGSTKKNKNEKKTKLNSFHWESKHVRRGGINTFVCSALVSDVNNLRRSASLSLETFNHQYLFRGRGLAGDRSAHKERIPSSNPTGHIGFNRKKREKKHIKKKNWQNKTTAYHQVGHRGKNPIQAPTAFRLPNTVISRLTINNQPIIRRVSASKCVWTLVSGTPSRLVRTRQKRTSREVSGLRRERD